MKAPFQANVGVIDCKALFERIQSFAWAYANLCVGCCKALRWHMQCFALAVAKLCFGGCNALRSEMGKTGTEIVSHILDKSKGRKDSPYGTLYPLGNYC